MKNTLDLSKIVVREIIDSAQSAYGMKHLTIPNGYEYVRFDFPKEGELYIDIKRFPSDNEVRRAWTDFWLRRIIVREVPYFKCQCAIENHNDVGDPGTFCPVCKGIF